MDRVLKCEALFIGSPKKTQAKLWRVLKCAKDIRLVACGEQLVY